MGARRGEEGGDRQGQGLWMFSMGSGIMIDCNTMIIDNCEYYRYDHYHSATYPPGKRQEHIAQGRSSLRS